MPTLTKPNPAMMSQVTWHCATVAEMKADARLRAGHIVMTLGYYAAMDRGAARYRILSTSDFGGTPNGYSDHAITGMSLVAQLVPDREPNAAQCGADLTGATSAIAAVSILIDLVNSSGGGVARLPRGTYLWDGGISKQGLGSVILEGEGNRTILVRSGNQTVPAIRFWGGSNNRIRRIKINCGGYAGRGVLVQDRFSGIEDCECINCPERPFALNGGGNASYGLDSAGRNSDDGSFTSATFYPTACWIDRCRVTQAGATAFSQKRMQNSRITHCHGVNVYSEGATADLCDYSVIESNTLINVALVDASAWPDLVGGGTLAGAGGGGVGGIGIDGASGVRVVNNTVIGVHSNVATVNNRDRAGICVVNNIGASFAVVIQGNHIEDAKVGIWLKGTGAGAAGGTFQSSVSHNTFKTMGTALGTNLARYGAIWADAGNNPNFLTGNSQIGGGIIVTDETGNNWVDGLEWTSWTPTVQIGGASTGITYSTQSGRYQRSGWRVFFEAKIVLTAKGSLTGNLKIGGLPVPCDANAIAPTVDLVWVCPGATIPAQPYAMVDGGASTISLFADRSDSSTSAAMTDVNLSATQTITIRGSYEV